MEIGGVSRREILFESLWEIPVLYSLGVDR